MWKGVESLGDQRVDDDHLLAAGMALLYSSLDKGRMNMFHGVSTKLQWTRYDGTDIAECMAAKKIIVFS